MNVIDTTVGGSKEIKDLAAPFAIQFGNNTKVLGVSSIRDAQQAWHKIRNALMVQGVGSRDIPTVFLVDVAKQKRIGRISWNSCVWNEHGEELVP